MMSREVKGSLGKLALQATVALPSEEGQGWIGTSLVLPIDCRSSGAVLNADVVLTSGK
jgi:hypothetical protein